jgi:hypothetical protein
VGFYRDFEGVTISGKDDDAMHELLAETAKAVRENLGRT